MKEAKKITSKDVAKLLGVEKEYNDMLFEEELKKNFDIIMSEDTEEK